MATNTVYTKFGATKSFMVAGGDVVLNVQNMANNTGAFSAQLNLGASPRPTVYYWRATTKVPTAPTVNTTIDIFAAWGDNSNNTNVDGVGAAVTNNAGGAITAANLVNWHYVGAMIVTNITNLVVQASGIVTIPSGFVQIAWFNNSGQALANTNTDHAFYLTPMSDDIAASA